MSPRPAEIRPIAATASLLFGAATVRRNAVNADEVVFWEDVVRKTPLNGRALNNLGYSYALSGPRAEAEAALRQALALDPGDVRAALNLKFVLDGTLAPRRELGVD